MLLHLFFRLLHIDVESRRQDMAVDRNRGVNRVIVLIKDYCQQLAKRKHGSLVVNLEKSFDPELVEQVDEELLSLLVPHDFSESTQLVFAQFSQAVPCF